MNLVFFGAGAFGLPTLTALAREHSVSLLVTQPDRPAGREMRLTPTPVGAWAEAELSPERVLKPGRVNEPQVVERIRGVPADAWVVIAFGQKLGAPLLEGKFAINLHASLLPRWRGAAPINHAILAGDTETGNSVIALADRMDAGAVYAQSRRSIPPEMTAGELHDALAADGPALVLRVLDARARCAERGEPQDETGVTLAGKLSKSDGWVDFGASAEECRRRVHGLTPWPGVAAWLRGEPLKILRVEALPAGAEQVGVPAPGAIVDAERGLVACGGGDLSAGRSTLRLIEVQPAGKRAMTWGEFARGRRMQPGERLVGGRPAGGASC